MPERRSTDLSSWVRQHKIATLSPARGVPSLVDKIAGPGVRGSWWSHPRGHEIYRAWRMLVDDPEVLTLKLVGGKVTYVHAELWPLLLRIVEDPSWRRRAVRSLDAISRDLLDKVERAGTLRLDQTDFPGGARALKHAGSALEERALVISRDVHTETGRHAPLLESWRLLRERAGARPEAKISLNDAIRKLKRLAGGNALAVE